MERPRASAITGAPQSQAQAGFGRGTGADPARKRLAQRQLARGTHAPLASRFATARQVGLTEFLSLHTATGGMILVKWPQSASEPTNYWLSTLPRSTTLADQAKVRWRSSGTIRNSSRRSASVATKAAAGEASTITLPNRSKSEFGSSLSVEAGLPIPQAATPRLFCRRDVCSYAFCVVSGRAFSASTMRYRPRSFRQPACRTRPRTRCGPRTRHPRGSYPSSAGRR